MRTEREAHSMAEHAEVGRALLEDLAEYFGCEASMRCIGRSIYKWTACGAWLTVDGRGLVLGSIVEGSSAEVEPRILTMREYLAMESREFCSWLDSAIDEIEQEAEMLWLEANGDDAS